MGISAEHIQGFGVDVREDESEAWLSPHGDLDIATAPTVERALAATSAPRVVIDLRNLTFADCASVRLLTRVQADLADAGRELRVVPGVRQVQRVLELTGTRGQFQWIDPDRRRFTRGPGSR